MNKIKYIFEFIKYIKPTWYFNISIENNCVWADYDKMSTSNKEKILYDKGYSTKESALRDAAFQALQKGVESEGDIYSILITHKPTVVDNYRFIRKYFNRSWVLYVFFIRLFTFKNIFKDIYAIFKTLKVKRIDIFKNNDSVNLSDYDSSLVTQNPKVSVVIPTLNRYEYLKDVLADLEKQDYNNFEVLVCDQTDNVDEEFYKKYNLDIKLIKQREKALWLARNKCVQMSQGEYLLLFDDDSRVEPDWITNHLRGLDYYNVDICSGISLSTVGAKIPDNYSFYRVSDQLDTGNVMLRKSVFEKVGLFDRQFEKMRMGDGEFGLRCYLAGINNVSSPDAKRVHLKVSTGGLRQMGSWDAFRPKKIFAPRPIPSVLYLARRYFGNKNARLMLLINVPMSIIPYKFKSNKLLLLLSMPLFIIMSPLFLIQIIKSWNYSSKMIKEGPKINKL